MKSQTEFHGREPRPVRPALAAGLVLAPLLAASAALSLPLVEANGGAAPAAGVTAEAPSPVNVIGALEGLPTVR